MLTSPPDSPRPFPLFFFFDPTELVRDRPERLDDLERAEPFEASDTPLAKLALRWGFTPFKIDFVFASLFIEYPPASH
jgi:hypothetical protein